MQLWLLAAGLLTNAPTFSRDVAPILYKRCASCHSDSKVAPFSLVGYASAKKRAHMIAAVTESKYMPPWKAKHGYGDFKDNPSLTAIELSTLSRWAKAPYPDAG